MLGKFHPHTVLNFIFNSHHCVQPRGLKLTLPGSPGSINKFAIPNCLLLDWLERESVCVDWRVLLPWSCSLSSVMSSLVVDLSEKSQPFSSSFSFACSFITKAMGHNGVGEKFSLSTRCRLVSLSGSRPLFLHPSSSSSTSPLHRRRPHHHHQVCFYIHTVPAHGQIGHFMQLWFRKVESIEKSSALCKWNRNY